MRKFRFNFIFENLFDFTDETHTSILVIKSYLIFLLNLIHLTIGDNHFTFKIREITFKSPYVNILRPTPDALTRDGMVDILWQKWSKF